MNTAARAAYDLDDAALVTHLSRDVDCVSNNDWHRAMGRFEDVHYEQTAFYGAGQRGEKVSHLLEMDSGKPAFGARNGLYTLPVINSGLALVRFGPFWRQTGAPHDKETYKRAIRSLIEEYCERRKLYLIIRPRAHPDVYPQEAEALQEMGVLPSSTTMLDRYFVDASLSEKDQHASLDKRWRYNLKTGIFNNLSLRISDNGSDIAAFQAIYAEMVARKNLNYPGVDLVDLMPQLLTLPPNMTMRVCLAYHENKLVAGAAFSVNGDLAYYVFGASSDLATEMQAGHVLQWEILRWLRENSKVRWYELGGPGDPGIKQFKKGLAGKRGVMLPIQEFHFCTSPIARATVKALYAVRDARNIVQRWRRGN